VIAGLVNLEQRSSVDREAVYEWAIKAEDLIILAGPRDACARKEGHRLVEAMFWAVIREGYGQETDAEREAIAAAGAARDATLGMIPSHVRSSGPVVELTSRRA
jgi:hypothetical protein